MSNKFKIQKVLICNPTKCSYTPFTKNGPCRFCFGILTYKIQ